MNYIDIIGFVGLSLVLIAFVMNLMKKMNTDSIIYNVLNAVGTIILAYYSIVLGSIPFLILQATWCIFALYNLIKILRRKNAYNNI